MSPPSAIEISVIVPLRNEQECVETLVNEVTDQLVACCDSHEIILVDDGSTDRSWSRVKTIAEYDNRIRGVRFTRGFGKESAIRVGLMHARGRAVLVMDCDLQHPPALIPRMIQVWRDGVYTVVAATKSGKSKRLFLNAIGAVTVYKVLKLATGVDLSRRCDFQLLDRSVVEQLNGLPERGTFFRALVAWTGAPTYELAFEVPNRRAGRSCWSLLSLSSLALDLVTNFTGLPLRLMTVCSLGFILLSAILTVHTLVQKIRGEAVEGFATVIICVLFVGATVTFGLGIIGEYLARLYDEVKRRPIAMVRETLNAAADSTAPGGPETEATQSVFAGEH